MSRHFVNSNSDGSGKVRPLSKENQKWLTKNLKSQPTVVEVYSPPRVTARAKQYGFTPGGALDLSTGWDFRKKNHQQSALRLIRDLQPVLVILSPPCTTFSSLRFLSNHKRSPRIVEEEEAEGLEHVRFSGLIAKIQHRAGRGFLFEHPRNATSWKTSTLQELRALPGVFAVQVGLCRFGLTNTKGQPALKPTLLLTNVEELATVLNRRCEGYHSKHQPLLSGEAKYAAKYTPAFVDAILRGLRQHVQAWVKSNNPAADYWELKDNVVTRHHRVPRRALFVPTGVAGCPQDVANLSSTRTTTLQCKPFKTIGAPLRCPANRSLQNGQAQPLFLSKILFYFPMTGRPWPTTLSKPLHIHFITTSLRRPPCRWNGTWHFHPTKLWEARRRLPHLARRVPPRSIVFLAQRTRTWMWT